MKNFVQPGDTVTLVAPSGGVVSGLGYLIGVLFFVAVTTEAAGDPVEGLIEGVVDLAADTGLVIDEGDRVFWDAGNDWVDKTLTAQQCVGVCVLDKVSAGAICRVKLMHANLVAS